MVRQKQTVVDLYHKDVPDSGLVRFHCRFERAVCEFYRRRTARISRSIRHALRKFRVAAAGGMLDLSHCSRFLARADVSDKVEARILLTVADKDLLEKMAFSLRLSQAEVLRMALEWNMEAISPLASREVFFAARRKWHHEQPNYRLGTMRFSFWATGRLLEWQFPPGPDIEAACKVIRDTDTSRFIRDPA